jgi:pimeloyl-ACP methyl ester carboxylesterase
VWDPVLELLAAERDVISVDLPGFGGSPVLDGTPPTPARLAHAVDAFARGLGVEDPHVAGNSLGGWVALEMALAGRARTVTAIAPAGLWSQPLMPRRGIARRLARAALPILPLITKSERGRMLALAGTIARPQNVPPRAAAKLVRAYATAPGFQAVNDAMRAGVFRQLGDIAVPVKLAWPQYDRLVARPRRLPPNVTETILEGCGHLPMWDDPEQVAAALLAPH